MFRNNKQGRVSLRWRYLALALAAVVLLAGAAGTMAWMQYSRTLQTLTLVQVTDLTIVGPSEDTLAMNLGEISVTDSSPRSYVFGVKSNNVDSFWIQLAYTTNIPLTYTIYQATKLGPNNSASADVTEAGAAFQKDGKLVEVSSGKHHPETYQDYTLVQENAEPMYVKYAMEDGNIPIDRGATKYFILEVSWTEALSNKETDMVYLTVGASSTGGGT